MPINIIAEDVATAEGSTKNNDLLNYAETYRFPAIYIKTSVYLMALHTKWGAGTLIKLWNLMMTNWNAWQWVKISSHPVTFCPSKWF